MIPCFIFFGSQQCDLDLTLLALVIGPKGKQGAKAPVNN